MFTYQVINMSSPVHCRVLETFKSYSDLGALEHLNKNKVELTETMVLVRVIERGR